jgi:adenine-specific DNA-methyltransferase
VRPCSREQVEIVELGAIHPPKESHAPWFLPRSEADTGLVKKLAGKRTRLQDWGYAVSTGPLVWNRHKSQLSVRRGTGALPLIWAEAVTADGRFIHRAEKRNHAPYFDIREGDDWLLVHAPCVLLQRTTAKEQHRRLIAAELPAAFLQQYGAAVIENHLNMVRPLNDEPKVSPAAVAAVLNSPIVDRAFRCISGSVAVSAFELEALPLPTVKQMKIIERLIAGGAGRETVNAALARIYGEAAA